MSGIILEPVDWRNMPPRQPHAQPVANLSGLIYGEFQATGRAYWLQAAGEMVCWVIVCQVGQQTLQAYGAGGPAGSLPAAHQIGMEGLRTALEGLACSRRLADAAAERRASGAGDAPYAQNSAEAMEGQAARLAARYQPDGGTR